MEMDLRTKVALQLGQLLLSNVEMAHQLEEANAQLAAQAGHATRAAHDATTDARDLQSGAPVPAM